MSKQYIEEFRIIPISQLIRAIKDGINNSERFCFILGAGASEASGIPSGRSLECNWMTEMENEVGLDEIEKLADKLKKNNYIKYDFKEIRKEWEKSKKSKEPLPSKYYFDIYNLRFFPNHRNGYHYLEKIMASAKPSFGYHPLARMLTDSKGNNLIITTNFDSLIEDALFIYTNSKPLVINHELLAEYAGDPNIKRPIIAKIHRGLFFDPFNKPEETNELKGKWHDILTSIFQIYTPIIIGYGGGDNSLMDLLKEESIVMKNGLYWCYYEEHNLPNEEIQKLVSDKKGYLVGTAGFDSTMLAIGNALFPNEIGTQATEGYLIKQANVRIANYEEEYKKLTEQKTNMDFSNNSEYEFIKEIEKIERMVSDSERLRQDHNKMTAWDYRRKGDKQYSDGNLEVAIEFYRKAIESAPNVATFYNDIGYSYINLKEYKKAIEELTKSIEINSEFLDAYNNRGYAYIKIKEYKKAYNDLLKAIEIDPTCEFAHKNLGIYYYETGHNAEALISLSKAISIDPNYIEAYREREKVYRAIGDSRNADKDKNTINKIINRESK